MLPRKSKSTARPPERPLVASPWLVLGLGALVMTALVLIYPHHDLVRRVSDAPADKLSSAYLGNLLRNDPEDPRLRLLVARRQFDQGELSPARATLQPALAAADPQVRRDARWLHWQIVDTEYQRSSDRSPARKQELAARLAELSGEPWPADTRRTMAERAFALGQTGIGIRLYRQLAEDGGDRSQAALRYAQAARQALGQGSYQASAELFLLARQAADAPGAARRHFHAALRALQSAGQPAAALELGERELGDLADDQETLVLLTELARASGRPDIAERHVRRLLKLSLLRQWQSLRLARAYGPGAFQPVALTASPGPGIAFDDKLFTLGYTVFLENRKLEDAWQVAASAVRQAPGDLAWRERLARVSEWSARPETALESWLAIARQTRQDDAWQAVLRLAPGLFDDAALIQGLRHQLDKQPGDYRLLGELVAAYERQGAPHSALAYLERQGGHGDDPRVLALTAGLLERAGQPEAALQAWLRLFRDEVQVTPARAVRVAVLLMLRGRGAEGLHWLDVAAARAGRDGQENVEFWRLTAQLAEMQQEDRRAIDALRVSTGTAQAEEQDYDALARLLAATHPGEAARVAAVAWERFGQSRHLLQALTLYAGQDQWEAMGSLFKGLAPSPQALQQLRRQPEFLRLAGNYHHHTGNLQEARRDFETGLLQVPDSAPMRQALLWLLIDSNDTAALRRLLASREAAWRADPALHDALAAAYQALSLPQVALARYLTPRLAEHQDDFLWLMNYADALEQNQHADRAWRLRRHLLAQEGQAVRQAAGGRQEARRRWLTEAGLDAARRMARVRLLLTQRPGDPARAALRELLRLDRDARGNFSDAAAETAIGWLQDAGEYHAERGFLRQQYARAQGKGANRPLWAEITLALADGGRAEAGQLLAAHGDALPRYDRINAARAVDDTRLAQSAAFDTQVHQTDDDPLHMQLADSLLAFSDRAGGRLADHRLGSLDERTAAARWHLAIDPRLALDFELGDTRRRATDPQVLRAAPDERFASLQAHWRHADSETRLLAERRHSLADTTPLQVEHEAHLDARLSLGFGLGRELPSQESVPLRVAGMKDRAAISLRYRPTRSDQVLAEHRVERYRLQTGAQLGRGRHSGLTFTHQLRQDAPDMEVSAFGSAHRFSREDVGAAIAGDAALLPLLPAGGIAPGYFLPDDFNFYGLRFSTDARYEREYTRALRPFASLSRTWHSQLGAGYDLRLGLAGSVLGADHFSLAWGLGKGGTQSEGRVRSLELNYALYY